MQNLGENEWLTWTNYLPDLLPAIRIAPEDRLPTEQREKFQHRIRKRRFRWRELASARSSNRQQLWLADKPGKKGMCFIFYASHGHSYTKDRSPTISFK